MFFRHSSVSWDPMNLHLNLSTGLEKLLWMTGSFIGWTPPLFNPPMFLSEGKTSSNTTLVTLQELPEWDWTYNIRLPKVSSSWFCTLPLQVTFATCKEVEKYISFPFSKSVALTKVTDHCLPHYSLIVKHYPEVSFELDLTSLVYTTIPTRPTLLLTCVREKSIYFS